MSSFGINNPQTLNTAAGLMENEGLQINPFVQEYFGSSKTTEKYTPGRIAKETGVADLAAALRAACDNGEPRYLTVMTNCTITNTVENTILKVGKLTQGIIRPGMVIRDVLDPTKPRWIKQGPYEETGCNNTWIIRQVSEESGDGSEWIISQDQTVYEYQVIWSSQIALPQRVNPSGTIDNITIIGTMEVLDETGNALPSFTVSNSTYDAMINIGKDIIPALGAVNPPTYNIDDPTGQWKGQANGGYAIEGPVGEGQDATWLPWNTITTVTAPEMKPGLFYTIDDVGDSDFLLAGALENAVGVSFVATKPVPGTGIVSAVTPNIAITQYGFWRLFALQAWNIFNYGGASPDAESPDYKNFLSTMTEAQGFIVQNNPTLISMENSKTFLEGTFSNMNDLMTGDLSGVSLAFQELGQDLINMGKGINWSKIDSFGLPSNLLLTLAENAALTQELSLCMLATGLTHSEIEGIITTGKATKEQEQKLFASFNAIRGVPLQQSLVPLDCVNPEIQTLADMLDVSKVFPLSKDTLTVPVYNSGPAPTNSKTYYFIYSGEQVNTQLSSPAVVDNIGYQNPGTEPVEPEPEYNFAPIIEEIINDPGVIPGTDGIGGVTTGGTTGGLTGGGGACVDLDSYLPCINVKNDVAIDRAWQLDNGFDIELGRDFTLDSYTGKVVKALIDKQPCVRITTDTGISLVCSTTAPILTVSGKYVVAPELMGISIAVSDKGKKYWSKVVSIEDLGERFVRVIDTGDNSFWAGEQEGRYILHHNATIFDYFSFDKE